MKVENSEKRKKQMIQLFIYGMRMQNIINFQLELIFTDKYFAPFLMYIVYTYNTTCKYTYFINICIHISANVPICAYAYMYTCTYLCIYVHIFIYQFIYVNYTLNFCLEMQKKAFLFAIYIFLFYYTNILHIICSKLAHNLKTIKRAQRRKI